ncbi:MAG: hypothetical protein ACR2LS_00525 [Thermomicrobiales bacterium]
MLGTMLAILRDRLDRSGRLYFRLLVPALAILLTLSACGDDEDSAEPTAGATLTPVSIVSGDPPNVSPAPGSPQAAPAPGELATVGELAAIVDGAWSSVTSYRATTTNAGSGGVITNALASPAVSSPVASIASPVASPPAGLLATDEIVMPDRRHQIVQEAGAESEFIAANGFVYTRGAYNRVYIDPSLGATTWVALDPAAVPANTPLAIFVERFAGPEPFSSPFANLQPSTLESPLTPLDVSTVDSRTCRSFQVVQTTQTGERVDITLAIDQNNLPCYEEIAAGGIVSRTTYGDFNASISIEPPTNAVALPGVASPEASPSGQ